MMSCPLSLPLPLLPPDLHADYPPVHIGIKVGHMLYIYIYVLHTFLNIHSNHTDNLTTYMTILLLPTRALGFCFILILGAVNLSSVILLVIYTL